MTEELVRSLRVIHQLERSIRILEMAREISQQTVLETIEANERCAVSAEITPIIAKAHAYMAACDRGILRAKARIDELERGDYSPT
jgi:hypothetical protein